MLFIVIITSLIHRFISIAIILFIVSEFIFIIIKTRNHIRNQRSYDFPSMDAQLT